MKMYSQFRATELKFKMMPVCNVAFDFHNVVISRGKYDDVLICHELNGLYYKWWFHFKKSDDFKR